LDKAEYHFAVVEATATAAAANANDDDDKDIVPETTRALNAAFMASARGEWDKADTILRQLVDSSSPQDDEEDGGDDNTHHYAVSSLFLFYFIFL
jgi:hypothetical protein